MSTRLTAMTIGQRIKKLRRKNNITQEQLAEYLNITPGAVSQWECDRVLPDLSQLPLLANILETSSDELLGIDVEKKAQKIDEICQNAIRFSIMGEHEKAVEVLREGLRAYPNSYKMMDSLNQALLTIMDLTSAGNDTILREIEFYVDKIFEGCTDDKIRCSNIQTACALYQKTRRVEKAVALAESIPYFNESRALLCRYLNGTKQYEVKRDDIIWKFTNSIGDLCELAECQNDEGTFIFTENERIMLYEKQIAMFALFFENGDYLYYAQYPKIAHMKCADIYAKRGNVEQTLVHLENAANLVLEFLSQKSGNKHISLVPRGIEIDLGCKEEQTQAQWMLNDINDSVYDFVRNHECFQKIKETLELCNY